MDKKYVEVRFRMLVEDFNVYQCEADELKERLGIEVSGTSMIKAETIKQADIKRNYQKK